MSGQLTTRHWVGLLMSLTFDLKHISALSAWSAARCDCSVDQLCGSNSDAYLAPESFNPARHMWRPIHKDSDLCTHVPRAIVVTSQCDTSTTGQNIHLSWRMEVTERLEGFRVSLNDYGVGYNVGEWFVVKPTIGLQTIRMMTFHICLRGVTTSKKNIAILRQPPLESCDNSIAIDFIPGDRCRTSTQEQPSSLRSSTVLTSTPGDMALRANSLQTGYQKSGAPSQSRRADDPGKIRNSSLPHGLVAPMETPRDWGKLPLIAGIVGIMLVFMATAVSIYVRKRWKSSHKGNSEDSVAETYNSKVAPDVESLSPSDSASQVSLQVLSTVAGIHSNSPYHTHQQCLSIQDPSLTQHAHRCSLSGQAYWQAEDPQWNQWFHQQQHRPNTQLDYMSMPVVWERPWTVSDGRYKSAPVQGSWKPPVANIAYSDIDEMVAEINDENASISGVYARQ